MNREQIMKLEGRELDALIAEKVMGWKGGPFGDYHAYSTDLRTAWEVVEKIGGELTLAFRGKYWFCDFGNQDAWEYSQSATPPLAICRAALLAVMEAE